MRLRTGIGTGITHVRVGDGTVLAAVLGSGVGWATRLIAVPAGTSGDCVPAGTVSFRAGVVLPCAGA